MSKALAEKLVALCEKDGITPNKLASETGVSQTALSAIINKHSRAREDTLVAIADYFGISVDELIDHKVKPRQQPLEVPPQTVTVVLTVEKAALLDKLLEQAGKKSID